MATVQFRIGAIEKVRKAVGARSDEDLARRIGVSRETLRLVESGVRGPSAVFIAGVCLATKTADMNTWFKVAS
ncbi:helix-turn-helix domain-containing protein [Rhodococcus jostii]